MIGAIWRTTYRVWILFAIIAYIYSDEVALDDVLVTGLLAFLLTILGFVPGFLVALFIKQDARSFKYLQKPKFGVTAMLYDPAFPGGKASIVTPQPFPVAKRIEKVEGLIPDDLKTHWRMLQEHPPYFEAIRQVIGVMAACPATPASTVPGGHRGATLLEHTFNIWRKMREELEAFEYRGMKDKRGNIIYPLHAGEDAPPYKFSENDPLPFLAAIAHDIGKVTCYKPGEGTAWKEVRPYHDKEGAKLLRRLKMWEILSREESTRLIIAVGYYHELSAIPTAQWIDDRARALAHLVYHVDNLTGIAEGQGRFDEFIQDVVIDTQARTPKANATPSPETTPKKKSEKYRIDLDVKNGYPIIQCQAIFEKILVDEFFCEQADYFEMLKAFCKKYPGLFTEFELKKIHAIRAKRNEIAHGGAELSEDEKIFFEDALKMAHKAFSDLVDRASGKKGSLQFKNYTPPNKAKAKRDDKESVRTENSEKQVESTVEIKTDDNSATAEKTSEYSSLGITDMPFDDHPEDIPRETSKTSDEAMDVAVEDSSSEDLDDEVSDPDENYDEEDSTSTLDDFLDDKSVIEMTARLLNLADALNSQKAGRIAYKRNSWLYIDHSDLCKSVKKNIPNSEKEHHGIGPSELEIIEPNKVSEFARRLMQAASRKGALRQEWNGSYYGATSAVFQTTLSKKDAENLQSSVTTVGEEKRIIIIRAHLFGSLIFNHTNCPHEPLVFASFGKPLTSSEKINAVKALTASWKEPLSKKEEADAAKRNKELEKVKALHEKTDISRTMFEIGLMPQFLSPEEQGLCTVQHKEYGNIFRADIIDKYFDATLLKKVNIEGNEYYHFNVNANPRKGKR